MFALTVKARPSTTLNEYQRNLKPVPHGHGSKMGYQWTHQIDYV
jgi:hypothetical protein